MTHTLQAEILAAGVLKAAGSSLRHYTMEKSRKDIFEAAQQGIDEAQKELIEALRGLYMVVPWSDKDEVGKAMAKAAQTLLKLGVKL